MGRLGCKCGKVLSSVDSPNDVELMVFNGSAINQLMSTNPDMLLTDVMLDYDMQDEYCWYCKDCGRVYVFRNNHQLCNRVYLIHDYNNEESLDTVLQLRELYIYTSKQIQDPTDEDFNYSLKDFFDNLPHPYRYYITDDLTKVYAYDMNSHSIAHCYVLEATYNDEPDESEATE